MAKEDNKQLVLACLLTAEQPLTLAQLAKQTKVSSKSVRNYLEEMEQEGVFGTDGLVRKPNVGIYLAADAETRAELQRRLQLKPAYEAWSAEVRQQYILQTLFKNRYTYTIQLLAEDLDVSKSTVVQDLACVQKWLERHQLRLERKPNRGLWIEGDEYVFRQAMMALFAEVQKEDIPISEAEAEQLDYRIDFISFGKIKQLFPRLDIHAVQTVLQQAEHKLDYVLTDEAFVNLLIHIAITLERIKQEREIRIDEERLSKLAANPEFAVAQWVVEQLGAVMQVQLPAAEVGYISLHLLGARVQQNCKVQNVAEWRAGEAEEYVGLAEQIVRLVSDILEVDLTQDQLLLTGLTLHLRPTVKRLQYGIRIRNPLLERIKSEYTSIFGAAWATGSSFERLFSVTLNEDEVAYIAMHIGAALERQKSKVRTIVVCASGVGTSQLVAVRLAKALPELEIVDSIPVHQLRPAVAESVELLVSTVALRDRPDNMLTISTLVDAKDVLQIRRFLQQRQQTASRTAHRLADLLQVDFCFVREQHASREELIRVYGAKLRTGGYTASGFIASALQREQFTSTAVGKGVAIPHGNDEFVIRPQICVVQLATPLTWGEEQVDLVFLLALNPRYAKRSFFASFYSMLDDEQVLAALRQAACRQELYDTMLREG